MSPQSTIAHYRIVSKLGEGGMGAVYRATDTKLNRDVAIKVLPAALAGDSQYMARFEREAQVLASLNHPNIAAIYGIEAGAIVMELVEGPEVKGPLPIDEAIPIARQIALGLEAAHEKGIIHRDLKPANIKITPAGVVKILDFGLAKPLGENASAATAASPTMSPTLSLAMTQAGMILGTAAYMAPEQARGKPVDKRADIWAFGVVLYEMLTGKMLFGGGETVTDILASVVKDAPDLKLLPASTPPFLRSLLERCLRKDANTRLRDIGEARIILESPPPAAADSPAPEAAVAWKRGRWSSVAALVMTAVAGVAFWSLWRRPQPPVQTMVNLEVDLGPDARVLGEPIAISPDGTRMVIPTQGTGGRRLSVRRLDQSKAIELPGTDGGRRPFFSPDGLWIAFFADGILKKISVEGGAAVTLCTAPGPQGGSWGEDGAILLNRATSGPLSRVSAAGGEPVQATELGPGDYSQRWPQILPGGKAVLVTTTKRPASSEGASVDVVTLADRKAKTVVPDATYGRYLPSGHLVWYRGGTLFAAPFDRERLEIRGEATPVIENIAASAVSSAVEFDFSQTGILVYRAGTGTRVSTVQWLNASGETTPLLAKPGSYADLRLAPDGKRLAIVMEDRGVANLSIYDIARETLSTLTPVAGLGRGNGLNAPVWSPDGEYLVYPGGSAGTTRASWIRVTGGGQPGTLIEGQSGEQVPSSFTPDGRQLLFARSLPRSSEIWMLPVSQEVAALRPGKAVLVLKDARLGQISPDGKWLAYVQGRVGSSEVYVTAFAGPASSSTSRWQISRGGAAMWSRAAQEIFYVSEANPEERGRNRNIMVVPYRVKGDSFIADKARVWAELPAGVGVSGIDLTPDGKRFVMAVPVADTQSQNRQTHVTFLLNFFDELRRKVPVK